MRKLLRKLDLLVLFAVCLVLGSCKNFLNGSDILEELENAIEYNNAPTFTVLIASTDGSGSFLTGNGEKKLKVGDSVEVEFKVSDAWQFQKWIAVDKDNQTKNLTNYIKFSNSTSTKTTVTLLAECENILVMPVSYKRPFIKTDEITPKNEKDGVPYNTFVKIPFNSYLKQSLEASKLNLSITSGSTDISQCFRTPVIDGGNAIRIRPDAEKYDELLSYFTNGKLLVTITIEAGWLSMDDIECNTKTSFSYTLNSTFFTDEEKAKIDFSFDKNLGNISLSGETEVYLDREYDLKLELKDDYVFDHWGVFYKDQEDEILVANDIISFTKKDGQDVPSTKFSLHYNIPNLIVKPIYHTVPKIIEVSPENIKTGVAVNTPIEITFDNDIEINSFRYTAEELKSLSYVKVLMTTNGDVYGYISKDGVYHWKNIEIISSSNGNILEYFKNPDFYDNNNRTLKIIADDSVPEDCDITVRISKNFYTVIKNSYGQDLLLKGANNGSFYEFTYHVNATKNEHKPEILTLDTTFAERNFDSKLTDNYFMPGVNQWLEKNRCGNKFFYSVSAYDEYAEDELHCSTLVIDRKYLYKRDGTPVSEEPVQKTEIIKRTSKDKAYISEMKGTYDLSDCPSGIYQFDFYIKSANGTNITAPKSYLICHVDVTSFSKISVHNEGITTEQTSYTVDKLNEGIKNFHVLLDTDYESYVYQKYNGNDYTITDEVTQFKTYVEYGNNFKLKTDVKYDEKEEVNKYSFSFTAPDSFLKGTTYFPINVVFEDSFGIRYAQKREIPLIEILNYGYDKNDKAFSQILSNQVSEYEKKSFYSIFYSINGGALKAQIGKDNNLLNEIPVLELDSESSTDEVRCILQKISLPEDGENFDPNNAIFGKAISSPVETSSWADLDYTKKVYQYSNSTVRQSYKYNDEYVYPPYFLVYPASSNEINSDMFGIQAWFYPTSGNYGQTTYKPNEYTYQFTLDDITIDLEFSGAGDNCYKSNIVTAPYNGKDEHVFKFFVIKGIQGISYTYTINPKKGSIKGEGIEETKDKWKSMDTTPPKVISYEQNKFNEYTDYVNLDYKKAHIEIQDDSWNSTEMSITVYYSSNPNLKTKDELEKCDNKPGYIKGNDIWVNVKDIDYYDYAYALIEDSSALHNYTILPLGKITDINDTGKNIIGHSTSSDTVFILADAYNNTDYLRIPYEIRNVSLCRMNGDGDIDNIRRESHWIYYGKSSKPITYNGNYHNRDEIPRSTASGPNFYRATFSKVNGSTSSLGLYYYFYVPAGGQDSSYRPNDKPVLETSDFILENKDAFRILRDDDENKPTLVHIMYSKTNYDEKYPENANDYWERYGTEIELNVITKDKTLVKQDVPSGYYYKLIGHCYNGYVYTSDVGYKE